MLGTPVHVDVFTDRIEVSNLGGLFGAVSKQRLTHEASTSTRNAFLFSLLRSTPYPDGGTVLHDDGTGYLRIGAALRNEAREPVRIDNSLDRFRVTIPGPVATGRQASTPVAGQGQRLDAVLEGEDAIDDVDDWPNQHRGNHRADADAAQPVEEDQ